MVFRSDDGDKDKFNHSLHHPSPLKFDQSLHYIAPLKTPILPKQKYYQTKHLECNSLYFTNPNDCIDCGNNANLNGKSNITVSAWIRSDNTASSVQNIITKGINNTGTGEYYLCYYSANRPMFFITNGAANGQCLISKILNISRWYHIIGIYNGTSAKMYLDGIEVDTDPAVLGDLNITAQKVYIGGGQANRNFNGSIKKVKIYNRAITPAEVLKLYQNKSISHTDLILDLPITSDYNSKTIIKDKSGNDNDGTLNGCTWNCDWIREKHKVI